VRVHLVIGPPLHPPPTEGGGRAPRRAVRDLTTKLRGELQALFDEAQRKAGAA